MKIYVMKYTKESLIRAGAAALLAAAILFTAIAFGGREEYVGSGLMCFLLIYVCSGFNMESGSRRSLIWTVGMIFFCALAATIGADVWIGSGFYTPADGSQMQLIRSLFNFGVCLAVLLTFCAVTGRIGKGLTWGTNFLFLIGLANSIVYQFKGGVLLPADLYAVGTAAEVVGGYSLKLTPNMYIALVFWYACLCTAKSVPGRLLDVQQKTERRRIRLCAGALAAVFFISFFTFNTEQYYYAWWLEDNGYPYTVLMNVKLMRISKPKGYEADNIEKIIDQGAGTTILPDSYDADSAIKKAFPEYYEKYEAKPVIIGIMNESFSDLSVDGEIETDTELFSNIDSLTENTIRGNLYTEVFGGGTSDTEYTFLTGNSTILFADNARAYELYVEPANSSLALSLKDQGYGTLGIHADNPTNWNRINTYPLLGFDEFISRDEFEGAEIRRDKFYSDRATYETIIERYESDPDPFFAFDVTIQNHGGYDQSYTNLEQVEITNLEGYPMAEQYVSLIRASDEDFGELIDYFSDTDRPVIICMFGDHQAKLDEGFYEALTGSATGDWTDEQSQNQQVTPFVIWANYDIPEETIDQMSVNYLGTLFMEASGTETTPYQQYLAWLYEQYPVIDKKGVVDAQGNYLSYNTLTETQAGTISDYRDVLYNNIFDTKERDPSLYTIGEADE